MASLTSVLPPTRLRLALKFAAVGLSGIVVNQVALAAFTEIGGLFYLISAIAATQVSSTWNFVGSEYWVFGGRPMGKGRLGRYAAFLALNNATLLLRVPLLWLFVDLAHMHYLIANPLTLLLLWAFRFLFADGWIWKATASAPQLERAGDETGPLQGPRLVAVGPGPEPRFHYDVAGVLRVDSDVRLPELGYFLTDDRRPADIEIKVMRVGALPSRRTRFVSSGATISYYEHLGLAGANFRITMGSPVKVAVAPLLARSPHVLYTNVIEALLRFLLVSRGYVLLHSASLIVDGHAVLLSAQTDTGKTSTVIQLVRDHGYQFLSDDMTIISADGNAICYPKPMTLSYHTMSSIKRGELRRTERAALAVQSRLHSKSGRSVGRFLGTLNLPIMSVNSIVQILVPPPKYRIDALMPARIGREAPISHAFLMERGELMSERLGIDEAIEALIANTDDAYGFPPFSTFAPHIRIGQDGYAELRQKEEQLLRAALANARVMRVRVPGHEWAELLPSVLGGVDAPEEEVAAPARLVAIPVDVAQGVNASTMRNAG